MADEHKEEEHKPEEHKGSEEKKGNTFQQHKTLWIVGGVGVAGVLLLLFMNSQGTGSQAAQQTSTTGTTTQGAGGAVDTSSLVGTGGAPSWYNPGTAENLDYWPYVPTGTGSSSSSSSKKKSSSGSSSKSKSSSGSSSKSKSSSGSSSKSKSSSGSSSKSGSTKKTSLPTPNLSGTHGYVYTTKAGDTTTSLQQKFFPTSNASNKQGNLMQYGNNAAILKAARSQGLLNSKGQFKAGVKIVA